MKSQDIPEKELALRRGRHMWTDKFLGDFTLDDVELLDAASTAAGLIPASTAILMDKEEERRLHHWLWMKFVDDPNRDRNFLGAGELAKMLGVTRQAVNKTPRYKNLIYNVPFKGGLLYYRPSVERFMETKGDGQSGDGRLKIAVQTGKGPKLARQVKARPVRRKTCIPA